MIYNPRSKKAIFTKYALKSTESVSAYLATKTRSAKEGVEDPQVEDRAKASLQSFVLSQVFSTISDAKLFFSDDPAVAYNELVELIQSPDIQQKVIEELTKQRNQEAELRTLYASEEAWAEHKALERCEEASKAVKSAAIELEIAKQWRDRERKNAQEAFPDMQFDDEE